MRFRCERISCGVCGIIPGRKYLWGTLGIVIARIDTRIQEKINNDIINQIIAIDSLRVCEGRKCTMIPVHIIAQMNVPIFLTKKSISPLG
jgi:hypothetical protein